MDKNFLSRFIKGVISTSMGTFIHIVLGFLGLMIAVRYVPKEQFGIFILLQIIATFFMVLGTLALANISVTKLITSVEDDFKTEVVNTAICYMLITGLIMCLVFFLCRPLINLIFKSEQLTRLLIYIPLFFILNSFNELFLKILQGFHQYKKMAISQVINGGAKFLLIVIFLIVLKMDVMGLIYAFIFSFAASVFFQYLMIPVKKRLYFNPTIFKMIFKFGFPLGLNTVLTFVFTKIDRFMIGAMLSPIGVAYYEIASRIPDSSRRIFESFKSVFFPNMSELYAKKRYSEAEKVLNNSLRFVSFFTIFAALSVILFQKEIVRILFSERYLESAPALSLLMFALSIGLIGNVLGTSLVSAGYSTKPLIANVVATIVNVLGNLIMIPIFGFIGAAFASVITKCITNPVLIWFLKKNGINVRAKEYIKPILMFIVCWFLFLRFGGEVVLVRIFLICLFLVLCVFLNVISKKDFLMLASLKSK